MNPLGSLLLLLVLAALAGLAGGYGGRVWALWTARRKLDLLTEQLELASARNAEHRKAVDEALDGFDRRLKRREGQAGQAIKRQRDDADLQVQRTLELELARRGKKPPGSEDGEQLDAEVAEALARLKVEGAEG